MSSEELLETERAEFFAQIRKELSLGNERSIWSSDLDRLWPGKNGRADMDVAHKAFQEQNVHWERTTPADPDEA